MRWSVWKYRKATKLENSRLCLIESVHERYLKMQHPSRPLAPAKGVFCFFLVSRSIKMLIIKSILFPQDNKSLPQDNKSFPQDIISFRQDDMSFPQDNKRTLKI